MTPTTPRGAVEITPTMDCIDLQHMRALIRSRHGLPDPPRQDQATDAASHPSPAPTSVEYRAGSGEGPGVGPARSHKRTAFGRAPPAPPAVTPDATAVAPGTNQARVEAEAVATGWTPDVALHRLVELVMEMQTLAGAAAPRSYLSRPETRAA